MRSHIHASVGTGVFELATYSDGQAPISSFWLETNGRFNIRRIRLEENADGCGVAGYNVDLMWVSAASGTSVLVNGLDVGRIVANVSGKQRHGHIVPVRTLRDDQVCVSPIPPGGFQFIMGPDICCHYDSYCYCGNCPEELPVQRTSQ